MQQFTKTIIFILFTTSAIFAQEPAKKSTQLNEIAITKSKKAVEQKGDRTIFDFANQSHLNSGSVLEGIKKLPGLVASDLAGMLYQGKQLEVYMDGRALNISSNELNAFLEGMPANAIEKIEIITQPGAEFPATSGGAILNIITNKNAKNYLSATYNNSSSFSYYDVFKWRINNSILLNAKNKYFGWQLNLGQNYRESVTTTVLEKIQNDIPYLVSNNKGNKFSRNNFVKTALTFDIGLDKLLLNYDINYNNNDTYTDARNAIFFTNDKANTVVNRQDIAVNYQKKFIDPSKRLDFKFNYNTNTNGFVLESVLNNLKTLDNSANQQVYDIKIDYSQPIKLLQKGKLSFGTQYQELHFTTKKEAQTNLNYNRITAATYLELQTSYKKLDFIVGIRSEDYDITGKTTTGKLLPFKQFKIFPNTTLQYNFTNSVNFNLNFNQKITLPSTSVLNPNNTNYQNPTLSFSGNPELQPTLFNNYEAKLSAFDYAFIGYEMSTAKNQVINQILLQDNGNILNTNTNLSNLTIHNLNIGMPIPYMLFTKNGLKKALEFNFNPDTLNFLYVYTGYQLHQIPEITTKGFWIFNLMSQIILPKNIKFTANFTHLTPHGNYYYFVPTRALNQSLDLSFSKKFLNNQLSLSINIDDILNTNKTQVNSYGTPLLITNKNDTRRFGFSINYKIPTKNKLAKETPNLLNKDKKDETQPIIN